MPATNPGHHLRNTPLDAIAVFLSFRLASAPRPFNKPVVEAGRKMIARKSGNRAARRIVLKNRLEARPGVSIDRSDTRIDLP